jgi:hypothetical protein
MVVSHWILLKIRNALHKICRENQTHILCLTTSFFPKIVPFMRQYGKMWSSQTGHRLKYKRRMQFACWVTKATCTQTLSPFPWQKLFVERVSKFRYTYTACLISIPLSLHIFLNSSFSLFICFNFFPLVLLFCFVALFTHLSLFVSLNWILPVPVPVPLFPFPGIWCYVSAK